MSTKAAITIYRSREEVEGLWRDELLDGIDATVTFKKAPGDRGTEVHVELNETARGGKVGEMVQKVTGSEPLAKAKDDLRRFKQLAETGVLARSDGTPEGELVERKLKQRPAQPLDDSEAEKAGV